MNLDSKNVFKGSFKDNKEDCSKDGEMQYGLGGQYVGQWAAEGDAEPVREGIGCMIMYDGKRYNGSWKKDSMAGEPAGYGVMIYVDGSTYEGDWVINPSQPAAGTNMGGAQQAFIEVRLPPPRFAAAAPPADRAVWARSCVLHLHRALQACECVFAQDAPASGLNTISAMTDRPLR